jgi:hypothetical protein
MPASIAHHVPGCPAFVPGIRLCGHGRSISSIIARDYLRPRFCKISFADERRTVRAFADGEGESFVLSRMKRLLFVLSRMNANRNTKLATSGCD